MNNLVHFFQRRRQEIENELCGRCGGDGALHDAKKECPDCSGKGHCRCKVKESREKGQDYGTENSQRERTSLAET